MKSIFIMLICFVWTSVYAQVWGPDTRLTDNDSSSMSPEITVSEDNVHVVWYDDRDENYEIYYKRSLDNGNPWTWDPDTGLTNQDDFSFHPSIAVSGDNIHVVWDDFRDGHYEIYHKRSLDNGATWESDTRLTFQDDTSWAADIAVSGDNIHVVWRDTRDGNQEIYYKRSLDNGQPWTWGSDTRLTNQDSISSSSDIAVSGDNVHVVWRDRRDGNSEIYHKRSLDNGTTWESDTRLTYQDSISKSPDIAVSGDNIHVVWRDKRDGNYEIYYKRSLDNGEPWTWGPDTRLTNQGDDSKYPDIAVSGDTINVVWHDERDGNREIYYKRSLDNGATWEPDTRLTDQGDDSFSPSVAVSGDNIHVVWYDYRDGNPEIYYKHGTQTSIEEDNGQILNDYSISLLFQNPSYNRSIIRYNISKKEQISLLIYDISGRIVKTLIYGKSQERGVHTVFWDGCDDNGMRLPSGVYVYQLRTMHSSITKNMIFLR